MHQFDVHRLGSGGLIVILQSDLRAQGPTRMVAPVIREEDITTAITRTDVSIVIDDETYIVPMDLMSAVQTASIHSDPIATVADRRDAFISAIDLVFLGF